MTIWIVSRSIPHHAGSGGMERVAYDLARDLRQFTGQRVAILTTNIDGCIEADFSSDGVEIHMLRAAPAGRYSFAWWFLTARSKVIQPSDTVLSVSNGAAAILLLRRRPPRTVIQAHGTPWSELSGILRQRGRLWKLRALRMAWWQLIAILCYRRAKGVVAVGESVATRLRNEAGASLWPASRVFCIPNVARGQAVAYSNARRARGRMELGVDSQAQLVTTVSRLVLAKGVDRMLNAMKCLPHYQVVVVGDGPEMAALRRLAAKVCPGRCHFTGSLTPEQVGDVLAASDVFAFPSRSPEREGLPMSALEAQASGLPIVASVGSPIPTSANEFLRFIDFDNAEEVAKVVTEVMHERTEGPPLNQDWARSYAEVLGVSARSM